MLPWDPVLGVQRQVTIAIVVGEPIMRDGLAACLSTKPDLRIVGTASSLEGEGLAAAQRADIVILDARMSGTRALEAVRRSRSLQPAPAIVLLSADDDAKLAADAFSLGVSAFVLKTGSVQGLIDAVRWVSKGEMWVSPPLLSRLLASVHPSSIANRSNNWLDKVTGREAEILELMVDGLSEAEIAKRLFISVNTVRTHTRNIKRKLGVHSNLALVTMALEEGIRPSQKFGLLA